MDLQALTVPLEVMCVVLMACASVLAVVGTWWVLGTVIERAKATRDFNRLVDDPEPIRPMIAKMARAFSEMPEEPENDYYRIL